MLFCHAANWAQSSGKDSNGVPGSISAFGSPTAGSYVYQQTLQM